MKNNFLTYYSNEGSLIWGGYFSSGHEMARGGIIVNPKYDPYNKEETSEYLVMAHVTGDPIGFSEKVKSAFNKNKKEILKTMQSLIPFAKIDDIELYGSITKGKAKVGSDIDVAVYVSNIKDGYSDLDVKDDLYGKIGIPSIEGAVDIILPDRGFEKGGEVVYYHGTPSKEVAKDIKSGKFWKSNEGDMGAAFYISTSANDAKFYSKDAGEIIELTLLKNAKIKEIDISELDEFFVKEYPDDYQSGWTDELDRYGLGERIEEYVQLKKLDGIKMEDRNDIAIYNTNILRVKNKMAGGGEAGIPERYKNMGFTRVGQKKKSTRPEKKWMVLAKKGDKYKVVHGGQKGMKDFSQHRDKKRQRRFWERMGGFDSEKANDPFSPLYWHKRFGTWEEGGELE